MTSANLLGEPPETLLPVDPAAARLAAGDDAADVARAQPTSSLAWAVLAERALAAGADVEAYAYARTGYHRSLDTLRRHGWKGHGPVPWRHEPNRGFLRALAALARAAEAIEESDEMHRCREFLHESSREAFELLLVDA
ncbi:MAG: hypothetical protein AVDCRST_MAG29-107 [uncultured Nocardioidaceae bacterium]|uniref:DUF3151 domain-containing protein n=1 Tax=uncultured Nocardioidaceae bacterium TaxID=253824 RepID=A0A6J4KW21_9ACTN|nr:MAG: hypothetical protein AVDCRST_MAG29-107 [uncultured Nocardioidaceae bacterium]